MNNVKIIHFHTFKNAGSTFDSILRRNFGGNFLEFHGPAAESSLLEVDILNFLEHSPDTVALSSHHFRFPINKIFRNFMLFPVSFVRHPIDRIYSVYAHWQRVEDSQGGKKKSFKEWTELTMNEYPYMIRDVQTNLYADGGVYYSVPDIATYERACKFIDTLEFCGLVEYYDSSIVWLEDILTKYNLHFDGAYERQNINPARQKNLEKRVEKVAEELGQKLYDHLLINNLYDLALYDYVLKKMELQLSRFSDIESKIASLQKRSLELFSSSKP